ncbi:putative epidermal cell surface receptor isoform X4 [Cimex lectularius]|uniref:Epidermal cell surface receptor n=1 Tax=Cimex lectularius TaxID=79782 RepID=A0A8I6R6H8_CIMLE|nr:putative epidermal cell surface receptor isoform X4 [Cimex lectularius]
MALILWFLLLTASSSLAQSLPAADKGGGGKARALGESGNLTQVEKALDDVSMEEDGMPASCTEGQVVEHGCDEKCVCVEGKLNCTQRCAPPLVRSILGTTDPKCVLKPTSDKCCSSLVCSNSDNEATSTATAKVCTFKNETYKYGDVFHDGCSSTCNCMENGEVTCKPRCPSNNRTAISDRCLSVADTKDPCCKILYCDVNIDDMSVDEILEYFKLVSAVPSNATSVLLNLDKMTYVDNVEAEVSEDEKTWTPAKTIGHQVVDLTPGKTYYFRVIINGLVSNVVSTTTPSMNTDSSKCLYKGNTYKIGEEFHDGCTALCACFKTGIECATIECPTDFGLDVLDPQCLSWETKPHDFVPNPPHCCPETVICTNNGSCTYKDELFDNWADIPDKLTGCEEKCYCENGKVNCRPRCLPVPNSPPSDLPCSPNDAILTHTPGEDNCCLQWTCGAKQNAAPPRRPMPGFPIHPSQHDPNGIVVHTLEAVDENNVRLIFSVPLVLVGLHGRVELRYTSDKENSDPSTWEQKVFAPANDLIATSELQFELDDLQPDTEYKIKITVVMRDIENSPASKILVVKTPPAASAATVPPMIPVEPDLRVTKVNSSWAVLEWRKFTEDELHFIDGVQLRYKEINGKVYQATPLIHRAVTSYTLEGLKPDSQYEIGIFFIPFPGQTTELQAQKTVHVSTTIENDPYKFELMLDVHHIKSTTVEISWTGVPYPEDKYVNIFRAIYQYEGGREYMNTFKVAKRDSPASTLIQGLKPDTRYRLWLEAYLTNGRIKKSNVKDFTTKQGVVSSGDVRQGKLEGSPLSEANDYYGPLIGVSILAAIAILTALGLLVVIARKHGHNKAPITAAVQRKSVPHTAAYDNPSYKTCESDISNGGKSITIEES